MRLSDLFLENLFFSTHRNDSWSKRCFPRTRYLGKYKNIEGKNYLLLSWGAASLQSCPVRCSLMLPCPKGPPPARGGIVRGWQCPSLTASSGREMQQSILLLGLFDGKGEGRRTLKSLQVTLWYRLQMEKVGCGCVSTLSSGSHLPRDL